jgi:streptogramin lyase
VGTRRRLLGIDGLVWVDGGNATAYRVDPQCNRVAGTLRLPAESRLAAVARGSLWLANEAAGTIGQADPRAGRTPAHGHHRVGTGRATPIHLGGTPAGAAFGAGSWWVSVDDSTLARIDPARRRVVATIGLDGQHLPGAVAVGAGAVWVFAGGLLQRVDPARNRVVHTLAVGPRPSTAAGSPRAPTRSG